MNERDTSLDVAHLARLARIKISDEEAKKLEGELGAVLAYVDEIRGADLGDLSTEKPEVRNILREDGNAYEPGTFKEDILREAPHTKGDYIAVKKIL